LLKSKIISYFPDSKLGFRDLKKSGLLDVLEKKYSVQWIFTDLKQKNFFKKKISFEIIKQKYFRNSIWSLLFELSSYGYYKQTIKAKQPFPFLGMGFLKKKILQLFIILKIRKILVYFLKSILSNTLIKREFNTENVKAIICFTSSKDSIYDDLVRIAKKNKIKIILVLINWDNATSKPYIEKPDVVLTWGIQTALLSNKIHKVYSKAIGSPRYESYKNNADFNYKVSLGKLDLNSNYKYIIFAGASFPSEEINILNKLSELIVKKHNSTYKIIYRPHPYSWKINSIKRNDYFNKSVIIDPCLSKFADNDFDQFRHLFAVSSALISPYSTMVVESLLNGKPVLALGINYDENFNWKLAAKIAPHLQILQNNNAVIHCYSEEFIEKSFDFLIGKINNKNISFQAKNIAKEIICLKNKKYSTLICDEINKTINL